MSHGKDEVSQAMQQAVGLLRQRKNVEAEQLLLRAASEAEGRFGRGSAQDAVAQNDLGNLYGYLGDMRRAAAAYRRACEGPMPTETQARRHRLTYLSNLGSALEALGELDEAEQVHRAGVAGRRDFYGADHPGHAFGLEPLGALLLRRGKFAEATGVLNEAVNNFRHNGHSRVASALAIRAEALKAAGDATPPFAGLGWLSDELVRELAETVLQRRAKTDPVWTRQVLADLLAFIEPRFGQDHDLTLKVLSTIANHEAELGPECDHDIRVGAIRKALESVERQGRKEEALHALQGLALALNAAGRDEEALAAYQDALGRAREQGERGLLSQVRRNYGLYLAELSRFEEAEQQLRSAVDDGEAAEDLERWARAEASLGIFLMHRGRGDEAKPLLEQSLRRLDPSHPDSVYARLHLNAIEAGQPCSCGDTREALIDQLRAYIWKQLPKGLLSNLDLGVEGDDIKVGVHLSREPSQEEMQRLQIVINQAIYAFKNQVGRRT